MAKNEHILAFEKSLGARFKDRSLLEQVFVHRSYLNEHPNFRLAHNERLEFLGDAVLELAVTEFLYRTYSNPEGELTNWRSALVRGPTLSKIAEGLRMNNLMLLSRGETKGSGKARQLILANAFEALVGALYLDRGYKVAQKFLQRTVLVELPEILKKELYRDSKSKLQEMAQNKFNITPIYRVVAESGPDHDKQFLIGVFINEEKIGEGKGPSKQQAEQQAAQGALSHWKDFQKTYTVRP